MDTVTVATKLPHGLVASLKDADGHVTEKYLFRGARLAVNAKGREISTHEVTGDFGEAYGLTPNIPRRFWEQWAAENASYPPFAKGFIFAQDNAVNARAQAREFADEKTGLEPMPGDNDTLKRESGGKLEIADRKD